MHVYVNYIINLFMDICRVPFKISRNRPKELFPQWFQSFRGLKPLSRFFKIFQDFQETWSGSEKSFFVNQSGRWNGVQSLEVLPRGSRFS